jgi:hypothetical protein
MSSAFYLVFAPEKCSNRLSRFPYPRRQYSTVAGNMLPASYRLRRPAIDTVPWGRTFLWNFKMTQLKYKLSSCATNNLNILSTQTRQRTETDMLLPEDASEYYPHIHISSPRLTPNVTDVHRLLSRSWSLMSGYSYSISEWLHLMELDVPTGWTLTLR